MTVAVTLTAEGASQEEAIQKIQRMARLLRGRRIQKKGEALPFMIGDVNVGSVQVEGVPEERELTLIRSAAPHPAAAHI
jgi:hypothetical protein